MKTTHQARVLSSRWMKHSVGNFLRALALVLLFVPAPLSMATATPATAEPAQTVAAEPAVIMPETVEEEAEDPWTARFLGPAVVGLGVVAIGASAAYYVVRIRGRYRVVE